MTRRPITQEESEKVVRLYRKGLSRLEVQIETNISQPTIRKILAKAGFPPNEKREPTKITKELREQIILAHNEGFSAAHISEKFGIAKRTALNILKEEVQQLQENGKSDVGPLEFIQAWQESANVDEVAAKLGLPHKLIYTRAFQYRQKGVPLKRYRFGHRYDWDELKEFAELFETLIDDTEDKNGE